MAGLSLTVDMGHEDLLPAWRTVIDVSTTGIAERLTLVGGLMVAAHARRSGVVMRRPTEDMDALVDYRADRSSLVDTKSALHRIGFELSGGERHAYRFQHTDGRKVDIMVADHLPSRMRPRLSLRPAFAAPAGEQAIRRRDSYSLAFSGGALVRLGIPDELGALVAKGAAYLVDQRDRGRHLDDAAVLLACITDVSALDFASLSKNDKRQLRAIVEHAGDERHPSWASLDGADRERGLMNATLVDSTLSLR